MLRVEYWNRDDEVQKGPGALVYLPLAAGGHVNCLVAPYPVLPFSTLSSLRRVSLDAPAGPVASAANGGIARDWARRVWGEEERGFTLVELTAPAVQAMLAARATSRAVGSAAEGMRATLVRGDQGVLALREESAKIARVEGETFETSDGIRGGLLVGEDGSLLAVTQRGKHREHNSLVDIVKEFLEDRKWQIRCHSLAVDTCFRGFSHASRFHFIT